MSHKWVSLSLLAVLLLETITPVLGAPPSDAAGHPMRIQTSSAGAAYNGGRIVFTSGRDGHSQIYAMEADGYGQVNLSGNNYEDSAPVIGPDGRIAFISTRDGNQEVYLMEADGGNQTRLTDTAGDEGFITWAPDGSRLAFDYQNPTTGHYQLVLLNPDGTERQVLFEDTEPLSQPDWSPDGSTIALFRDLDATDPGRTGIWTIPADDGTPEYTGIGFQHPHWSPDGSRFAFVYFRLGGILGQIGVMNADGSGDVTWVSPGQAKDNHPRWSPDGRRILFDSNVTGYEQLYVTRSDGSTATNYLNLSASGTSDAFADWSTHGLAAPAVSGPYVAYQTGGLDGPAQIHLYDETSGETTTLVQADGLRLAGLFAPWLVYQQENAYGGYDIWAYDLETDETKRISSVSTSVNQNRPFIDSPLVIWRQTSGSTTAVSARFYAYNLIDETTTHLNTGDHSHYYSVYTARDGLLALIAPNYPSGQRLWIFDVAQNDYRPDPLPYDPVVLGGLSGNRLAALERSSGSNDLLVTYVLSPTARLEVGTGAVGVPQIEDEVLVWQQGDGVQRWDLREAEVAEELTASGTAPAIGQGRAVWLDADGQWALPRQDTLDYYTGWSGEGGDYTFDQPASTEMQVQSSWPANQVATVLEGEAYRLCKVGDELWYCTNIPCQPGWPIYAGDRLHVPSTKSATFRFRDGSTLRVGGGNYLWFRGFRPTGEGTIGRLIGDLEVLEPNIVADLKTALDEMRIEAKKPPEKVDLSKIGVYLTEVQMLSKRLASASARRIRVLRAAGKGVPSYLYDVNNLSAYTTGAVDRLGKLVSWVQVATSLFRLLNLHRYTDDIYKAFEAYLGTIGRVVKKYDGTLVFYPAGTNTDDYLTRVDVLFKMVLDDGYTCFRERDWTLTRYTDGSVKLESSGCGAIHWSKFEAAKHFVRVDGSALRRSFLAPLLTNSLKWYESLAGLITPGEATVIYANLTRDAVPKRVEVTRGRMEGSLQMARAKQEQLPTLYSFPGVHVLIWGTAFEATVETDGSGTFFASEGMPVEANLDAESPDSYGVTWRDGNLSLAAPPGEAPLEIPTRVEDARPQLVEIFPHQASAVGREDFHYELSFTVPMSTTSVTTHGQLMVTTGGSTVFSGALGSLPHTWNALSTTLTLTPTTAPDPGVYELTLTLPTEVVSQEGLSVPDSPFTTTFAVIGSVGIAGGHISTPNGARLSVPSGALVVETGFQITATQVFSAPEGWVPSDGVAYGLSPEGQTFAVPITLTLPVTPVHEGMAIFRWDGDRWLNLGGELSAAKGSVSITTTHLSTYATFWPVRYVVYLPLVLRAR